jgi:hypothetical protein
MCVLRVKSQKPIVNDVIEIILVNHRVRADLIEDWCIIVYGEQSRK